MARKTAKQMITGTQVRLIHTLTSALKIEDCIYRDILHERYQVKSSKDLDTMQAAELIRDLEAKAVAANAWQKKNKPQNTRSGKTESEIVTETTKKYEDLEQRRSNMATPAQLRKIEVMWDTVSKIKEPEARQEGLRRFIKRQAKVHHIRFLDLRGASAVICALETMQKKGSKHATEAKRKKAV